MDREGPALQIKRRPVFADVTIDLWPCPFDLTKEGQELCQELLRDAATKTARTRREHVGISFSAGASSLYVHRVLLELADPLAQALLTVVTDPEYQEPIGWPIEDE